MTVCLCGKSETDGMFELMRRRLRREFSGVEIKVEEIRGQLLKSGVLPSNLEAHKAYLLLRKAPALKYFCMSSNKNEVDRYENVRPHLETNSATFESSTLDPTKAHPSDSHVRLFLMLETMDQRIQDATQFMKTSSKLLSTKASLQARLAKDSSAAKNGELQKVQEQIQANRNSIAFLKSEHDQKWEREKAVMDKDVRTAGGDLSLQGFKNYYETYLEKMSALQRSQSR